MLKIYHNNRCSKSRCALDLLNTNGQPFEIIDYLKTPPTVKELKAIIKQLKLKPEDIIRKGEPIYKEQFAGKTFSDAEWMNILVANPILIERPIVVSDKGAVIARPVENLNKIL